MVGPILAAALLMQQPTVAITVDRSEGFVGDQFTLTITARTDGSTAVEFVVPDVSGLDVGDVRDRSSVRVDSGRAIRETVRQVVLRARAPGQWTVGPIEVRQGSETVRSGTLTITVRLRGAAAGLPERVRLLADRARAPPLADQEVGVTLVAAPESALVGQQVDILALAWIPREVRAELRTPPTVSAPQVTGAWVYHDYVPATPTMAREINGRPYDVYVLHDAVFPLRAGSIDIGPATVSYAVPVSQSILSREVRHDVQSAPASVVAVQPPGGGGSSALPVGTSLRWVVDLPTGELPLGEARQGAITIAGAGNVALWPAPVLRWPGGLRVYADEPEVDTRSDNGLIVGSKVFRYLIVPDSGGTRTIAAPTYRYFDVARDSAVTLTSAGAQLMTAAATAPQPRRATVPQLLVRDLPRWERGLSWRPRWWLRLALFAVGPVGFALIMRPRRRRRVVREPAAQMPTTTLGDRAREFSNALGALIPQDALREGRHLADALRAAGVDAAVAQHATRVRDRLRQAVFGPGGAPDVAELDAEVEEVLRVLVGEADRRRHATVVVALLAVVTFGGVSSVAAQTPARLYEAGAFRAAADSFQRRVAAEPADARHWYNLGASLYAMGDEGAAQAAWVHAGRLAPRDALIRRWRAREGAMDPLSASLTWVSPVTSDEALLFALVSWTVAWIVLTRGRKLRRWGYGLLLMALASAALGSYVQWRYTRPVALLRTDTPLREAPYASAPAAQVLDVGSAVQLDRARGAWVMVERGSARGWVPAVNLDPL